MEPGGIGHVSRQEELAAIAAQREQRRLALEETADVQGTIDTDSGAIARHEKTAAGIRPKSNQELQAPRYSIDSIPAMEVDSLAEGQELESISRAFEPDGWKFQVGEPIGEGAYGEVFKLHEQMEGYKRAMHGKEGAPHVLKVLKTEQLASERAMHQVLNEIEVGRAMGLVEAVKRVRSKDGRERLALVMKYVPDEALPDFVMIDADFETPEAAHEYIASVGIGIEAVAQQLKTLADNGWVHRDVKPGNIRFDAMVPMNTRLIDPGAAIRSEELVQSELSVMGTPGYVLPERAAGRVSNTKYDDLYALGVTLGRALGLFKKTHGVLVADLLGQTLVSPDRDNVKAYLEERYGHALSPEAVELAELAWDMVVPNADINAGERTWHWMEYEDGRGMDMEMVTRKLDDILYRLGKAQPHTHLRLSELKELQIEVDIHMTQQARETMTGVRAAADAYDGDDTELVQQAVKNLAQTLRSVRDRETAETFMTLAQDLLLHMGVDTDLVSEGLESVSEDELSALLQEADQERIVLQQQQEANAALERLHTQVSALGASTQAPHLEAIKRIHRQLATRSEAIEDVFASIDTLEQAVRKRALQEAKERVASELEAPVEDDEHKAA